MEINPISITSSQGMIIFSVSCSRSVKTTAHTKDKLVAKATYPPNRGIYLLLCIKGVIENYARSYSFTEQSAVLIR
jgi:hypothetical protein